MKKSILFLFVFVLIILAGCSEPPEEMSTIRPYLILDIFKLIKQNRHDEAYVKIRKLRDLEPANTLLPVLEDVEKNNSQLQKINALFQDKNKQSGASAFLKKIVDQYSYIDDKNSNRSMAKLKDLFRLDELSDIIMDPKPVFQKNFKSTSATKFAPASMVMDHAIEEFVLITQKWNISSKLRNKVIRQKQTVARLRKEEALRAVQSLELFAPGLAEKEYQTMMALSFYAAGSGTK